MYAQVAHTEGDIRMLFYYMSWLIFLIGLFLFKNKPFVQKFSDMVFSESPHGFGIRIVLLLGSLLIALLSSHPDLVETMIMTFVIFILILLDSCNTFVRSR